MTDPTAQARADFRKAAALIETARHPPYDPDSAVVAFCAPGAHAYAERLLGYRGEIVREIRESPYMAGRTDVILVVDPTWWADLTCRPSP